MDVFNFVIKKLEKMLKEQSIPIFLKKLSLFNIAIIKRIRNIFLNFQNCTYAQEHCGIFKKFFTLSLPRSRNKTLVS